jgi:hypothetical protein
MRQALESIVKTACLGLVAVVVSLGTGCDKKPEPASAPPVPNVKPQAAKPAEPNKPAVTEKPAPKPAADANKPAAPAANAAPANPPAGMVPLALQLPKAIYVGTPQNLSEIKNLRPVSKEKRPSMLVPAGTKLLSLKKPVTASDDNPIIGEVSYITDGDKEGVDGTEVQLAPGKQHVTIDLGQECEISAIVVWHYHKQACVVNNVAVQVAKDKDFITDVKTVFNNDAENTLGLGVGKDQSYVETNEGELIDCISKGSPKARYVRLYSKGCNFSEVNYYIEVEVYGKPLE